MYHVYRNQAAASYLSLYFFIFLSLQYSSIKKIFVRFFSGIVRPRRSKLCTNINSSGCIVYSETRLLLLIHPFSSSFFFLSNFQTLKIVFAHFTGTVRPRKLILGTHVDNGWVYCVSRSGCCCLFVPLFLYFSSSPIFKHFCTFRMNLRPTKLKLCTHMNNGWIYCAYQNQIAAAYLSL